MKPVNIYQAKTHLSELVDEAARGKRIVIAKNGVPQAMLVPLPKQTRARTPAGSLIIEHLADDFDAPDAEVAALFGETGES
jgi:prevent-host-death family protein